MDSPFYMILTNPLRRSLFMLKSINIFPVVFPILLFASLNITTAQAESLKDLGLVKVKSFYGGYLQAHESFNKQGIMHASKKIAKEDETWHLIEVDGERHIYALLNCKNQLFMNKQNVAHRKLFHEQTKIVGCAPADAAVLDLSAQWILVSGNQYGVPNAVAFKSVADGTFLGTIPPGQNCGCGGEVGTQIGESVLNGKWKGWWIMEPATPPVAGQPFWKKECSAFIKQYIVPQITSANVAKVVKWGVAALL